MLRALNIVFPLKFRLEETEKENGGIETFPSASSQADRNFRYSLSALNQVQREQEDRSSNA
ncbi:hypothetical protein GCM10026988_25630 [Vibrio panuliri]